MELGRRLLAVAIVSAMATNAVAAPASKAPVPASNEQIAKLIESLGDKDYAVRQRAEEELARIGFAAYEAIEAATQHEDLEVASRARHLLRELRAHWASDDDPPEVKELLEDYDAGSGLDRMRRVYLLATLPDLRGVAALCRIARFESAAAISAHAALAILYQEPFDATSRLRLRDLVRANLGDSKRPAMQWILAYVRLREDPGGAMPEWSRLVESEFARWQKTPAKADAETVVGLLYLLAETQVERGDGAAAEQTVGRARRMPLPEEIASMAARSETVSMLARRGSAAWFEAECRALMDSGRPELLTTFGRTLAEYLHDEGKDLAAAEAYQKTLSQTPVPRATPFGIEMVEVDSLQQRRARMNYFLACHWSREHDAARELQFLQRAFQADPQEVDTLIACSRVANPPPQFRERVAAQIAQETARLGKEMAANPSSAQACNEFAWLVCNTKGDLDQALRASRKSLELSPNQAAYLDTLAHVYFAQGDLQNAVKYQTMAAEREPHLGLLSSELKRFREALEEKGKKT